MSDAWTTIESDPGVFTELIESMGVKSVQVEEIYALDPITLSELRPVYGLIFLFKWRAAGKDEKKEITEDPSIYFASQVITNACATQAMLSILLNQGDKVDIGQELANLKEFTADFPPDLKGHTIGNADGIRRAHNSFTPPEACISEQESKKATEDDDVYHFISYIHSGGALWELDGLQAGPIKLAQCTEDEWLERACPIIDERIRSYSTREIRFNLMAVVKDRRKVLQASLDAVRGEMDTGAAGDGDDASALETEVAELEMQLEHEVQKRSRWAQENVRRKHNYIPFIFNLLKTLARKGELQPLIDQAREKATQRA